MISGYFGMIVATRKILVKIKSGVLLHHFCHATIKPKVQYM